MNKLETEEELNNFKDFLIFEAKKHKEKLFKREDYKWRSNQEKTKWILHHKKANTMEYIPTNKEMDYRSIPSTL